MGDENTNSGLTPTQTFVCKIEASSVIKLILWKIPIDILNDGIRVEGRSSF